MQKPVFSDILAKPKLDETATLRTLNAFAIDMIAIPNVEELFWYVAQNVVGRLNFIDCVIYEANETQTELTQVAALGEKNPYGRNIINPLKIPFGQGITGRVARDVEPIIVDDLLKDQNYIPDTQIARSEICVPLVFRGRVVGVIDSEHPDPNAFGEAEVEVLTTVAAMTSAKLELLAEADRSNSRYRDLVKSHADLSLETSNRKALEAKLFEARRLEAIGRLSGRFAHDFNNFLTVISGNLEILKDIIDDPVALECLEDACTVSSRGAKLIKDMLAFSQRRHLDPERCDLNAIVADIGEISPEILTQTAGLKLTLADSLWSVKVDPNATKEALLNLVFNGRDAMPEGGDLTIATENVAHTRHGNDALATDLMPGKYVVVSIQDEGVGISQERLRSIFDPFYTTKEVGAGSGLGLSMILGFMQQSGGSVAVTSKINQGSTFRLYFPAIDATATIC